MYKKTQNDKAFCVFNFLNYILMRIFDFSSHKTKKYVIIEKGHDFIENLCM